MPKCVLVVRLVPFDFEFLLLEKIYSCVNVVNVVIIVIIIMRLTSI